MSEPPPGAVLMMNSTGFVGGTIAPAPGVPPADAATEGIVGRATEVAQYTGSTAVRCRARSGGTIATDGTADAPPAFGGREANGGTSVMVKELTRPATPLRRGAAPDTAWAFFDGEFVPRRDAKVSVLTPAFNYGTGVFEGIRAYWNAERGQLYGLHLLEHSRRLPRSCKVMRLALPYSPERLVEITVELLRRSGYREGCYVRPLVYKSSEIIRVPPHELASPVP